MAGCAAARGGHQASAAEHTMKQFAASNVQGYGASLMSQPGTTAGPATNFMPLTSLPADVPGQTGNPEN